MVEELVDQIQDVTVEEEVPNRFLRYAKYVILDRALPDARDGLKPVQRRVLYAAHELGLTHKKPYKKSARIVGDAMGKYHPHGDTSIYEALVRMAQHFSMRYTLIDGHGNFGSVDGDPAAAMRYTESRLSVFGEMMMQSIDKETVDYRENFDNTEQEPSVLPTLFPNLLGNGTEGIAVGMASSIPPHHIPSLYEAVFYMIDCMEKGEAYTIEDLIAIVKMPDFPTGGTIINKADIEKAYRTGKGRAIVRSKYEIVENKSGTSKILVTELPYAVNKASLIKKIDELRKLEKIEGINHINDDSSRKGMSIRIDVKKGFNPNSIIQKLFKMTDLQASISMNHMAIFEGRPKQFTLLDSLETFLTHVSTVLLNENQFDLDKAEKRMHIVEGLIKALDQLDGVIELIRKAKSNEEAYAGLEKIGLTNEQAKAVVAIRLISLSAENQQKYIDEYGELSEEIQHRQAIMTDEAVLYEHIRTRLKEASEPFEGERKTDYHEMSSRIDERDLVPSKDLIITITANGIVKAVETSEYSASNRNTKGQSAKLKDDDAIEFMFTVNTHDDLLIFTDAGRCHLVEAYKLPISTKAQAGKYLANYIDLDNEKIVDILPKKVNDDKDILLITKQGTIKRIKLSSLSKRTKSTRVITFVDDDELNDAVLIEAEKQHLITLTANGKALRIDPNSERKCVRPMGRHAAGVKLITLLEGDYIVKSVVVEPKKDLIFITEKGYGKRIETDQFGVKNRGGQGVKAITVNERTGVVVDCAGIRDEELFIATANGMLNRIQTNTIRRMGTSASGVSLIDLKGDDTVLNMTPSQKEENIIEESEVTEQPA